MKISSSRTSPGAWDQPLLQRRRFTQETLIGFINMISSGFVTHPMEEAIKALRDTPLPTLLIVAGLFFILIGFVNKLGGIIEVSPDQKKLAIPVGLLILAIGLVLNFQPVRTSNPPPPAEGADWQPMGTASTGEAVVVDGSSISGSGAQKSFTYRIGAETVLATADCNSGKWLAKKYGQWQAPLSRATEKMIAYVCK